MKNKETGSDIEALVPLSNLLVDLINDDRIPKEIRTDYTNKLQKVAPWIPLLSLDYAREKYQV